MDSNCASKAAILALFLSILFALTNPSAKKLHLLRSLPHIPGSNDTLLHSAKLVQLTGEHRFRPKWRRALYWRGRWTDSQVGWIDFAFTTAQRQFMLSLVSGDKTGRLLKYKKLTRQVNVLLQGLVFANGAALSKDHSFVLVADTTTRRVLWLWLSGPNTGKSDVFSELLGFPDNVRTNSKGEFWVALHAKRGILAIWFTSNSWAGKALLKLPLSLKQL